MSIWRIKGACWIFVKKLILRDNARARQMLKMINSGQLSLNLEADRPLFYNSSRINSS